jgi:Ala-tRNA(Pro) deacylase
VVNRDSGEPPSAAYQDLAMALPLRKKTIGTEVCFVRHRTEGTMVVLERLQNYLKINNIPYTEMPHSTAFTAREVAENLHVPARMFAKVVVVKADGRFVMAVLPSSWLVDLKRLEEVLGYSRVRLATEDELATLFPDCEIGTMPPFGNLYGLPVYVDELLAKNEDIYFDAGTHKGAIKLRYQDFADRVHPQVAEFHREPTKLEY